MQAANQVSCWLELLKITEASQELERESHDDVLHGCDRIRPSDDMKLGPHTGSICIVQNADDQRTGTGQNMSWSFALYCA